ncbi:MAG: purine-nucleoside phosphorylase [Deltaproteobacteria bacterium]|nr:purine-nucleoside phosphorylase [Deltaproteobacteria bacterium]
MEASFQDLGLPGSTVPGHAGRVVVGRLGTQRVALFAGRVHLYEGHPAPVLVRGIRALAKWGVSRLILTCSVGGITEGLEPGTLVLVTDHLNLQGANPLTGPAYGARFPDVTRAYDPRLRAVIRECGQRAGLRLIDGVLAAMPGPAYETPAEIRMLRALGADVVGMSTVPEVLAAAEIGLPCAVVAVVSNRAAGLSTSLLNHQEVTDQASITAIGLAAALEGALDALG